MKKKRKNTRKRRIIVLSTKIVLLLTVMIGAFFFLHQYRLQPWEWNQAVHTSESRRDNTEREEEIIEKSDTPDVEKKEEPDSREDKTDKENTDEENTNLTSAELREESVYTFMQGPKAWSSKIPWSGEWCEEVLSDSKFSVFGCGLCDLANIYSTLSPYECSPLDMFHYAKEVSEYSPGNGVGAIDWPDMQKTLETVGFTCSVGNKDATYEEFCRKIENALTAIVLVSAYDDPTYWQDTGGHYVNIWLYNSENQEVFLADSGDPEHNRKRIPLKYVYDALMTSSTYQYLLVYSYDENKNSWKHNEIKENWTIPDYYVSKSQQ